MCVRVCAFFYFFIFYFQFTYLEALECILPRSVLGARVSWSCQKRLSKPSTWKRLSISIQGRDLPHKQKRHIITSVSDKVWVVSTVFSYFFITVSSIFSSSKTFLKLNFFSLPAFQTRSRWSQPSSLRAKTTRAAREPRTTPPTQ